MRQEEVHRIQYFAIVLYGFPESSCSIAEAYDATVGFFVRFGCAPNQAGANVGGKWDAKLKSFPHINKKLGLSGFSGVTGYELHNNASDLVNEDNLDYKIDNVGAIFSLDNLKCFLFAIREAVVIDRVGEMLEVARTTCNLLRPQYGFIVRCSYAKNPLYYGLCIGSMEEEQPFDGNMINWSFLMQKEAFVFLRDLYPWNFLTKTQLDFKVDGVRLEDWIRAESTRGTLAPFTGQMALWTVPTQSLPEVRMALWNAGVILDTKRHFDPLWHKYQVSQEGIAEHYKTGKPLVVRRTGPGISQEQMQKHLLKTFGDNAQILKVEESGQVREVTREENSEVKIPKKPSRPGKTEES